MRKALILFVITIVLTLALFFLVIRLLGVDIDLSAQSICLLVALSGPTIIYIKTLSRLRYLERANSLKPSFKIAETSFISFDQSIDFSSIERKISNKWIITLAKIANFGDNFRIVENGI